MEGDDRTWLDDVERRRRRRDRRWFVGAFGALLGTGTFGFLVMAALFAGLSVTVPGCDFELGDPGDGKDSRRLPVAVSPTTGLTDGATVGVTSDAFAPDTVVGIAQCLSEAATVPAGVEACDTDGGQRFAVDGDGRLSAVVPVDRVITVGGEAHDCAEAAERCVLVAADAGDYSLSGGQPLTFADGLPAVELVARTGPRPVTALLPGTLTPEGPVAAGTEVRATASGFVPGEPLIVALCSEQVLRAGPTETCDPLETGAVAALMLRNVESVELRADEQGRVTTTATVPAEVVPFAASEDTSAAVDCTSEAGACALVVAAAADTQRSAYFPLTVTPA